VFKQLYIHFTEYKFTIAFWLGNAAIVFGVLAHLPMFIESASMNYMMAGMKMGPLMMFGMAAIVVGIGVVGYALIEPSRRSAQRVDETGDITLRELDDAQLTPAHWKLFVVLAIALIVDVMKPATLGFVLPGTAAEYGLSKSHAAIMPVVAIIGTTIGSFVWGWAADKIGRRTSILLAAIVFIGTSICGAMPSYSWNIFMCFLMGLGAGGMLPIAFALLAEIAPVRHRGFMIVLIGGIGAVGGYLAASGLAALLEPTFGWRILWLVGLPTGILLIILNRYIPESPRFLISQGRAAQADRVMASFGVIIEQSTHSSAPNMTSGEDTPVSPRQQMFRGVLAPLTYTLGLYGFAWGVVNFGFLLWLPLHLREAGFGVGSSDALLARSAIIAFPSTLLVAWAYHNWSARGTLTVCAILTTLALFGFVLAHSLFASHVFVLAALIVVLLAASSGAIAALTPYTAEVFPLRLRATGAGWSAGCSKAAGVTTLSAALIGVTPGIAVGAFIAAIPTACAAIAISYFGTETKGRSLDSIQQALRKPNPPE